MKTLIAVRISEQQKKQLDELIEARFGNQSDVIRTAIDRMYQQEIRKGEKIMSRNWLGYQRGQKSDKQRAIEEFESIGVGGFEPEEYEKLSTEDIDFMGANLEAALREYKNSLDSPDDIDTNRVMEIVEEITLPYLEGIEE